MKNTNTIIGMGLVSLCVTTILFSVWTLTRHTESRDYQRNVTSSSVHETTKATIHEAHDAIGSEIVMVAPEDPRGAIEQMKALMITDEKLRNNCHGVMHQIGVIVQQEYGFTGAMAFQDGVCGSGFIHGVIMGEFGIGHKEDVDVGAICEATPTESCYHGIGHGLMVLTENAVEESLSRCDQLPEIGQRDCYDGVFMHVYDNEENGIGELVDISNFETLCSDIDDKYSVNCFFYMPRYFARKGAENVTQKCLEMQDLDAYICAMGAGHTNMKYNIKTKELALDYCDAFVGEERIACRDGAFKYYFFDRSTAGLEEENEASNALCKGYFGEDFTLCEKSHKKYFGII